MSAPDIPTSFTFTLGGGVDAGLDDIRINSLPLIKLETAVTSLPEIVTESKVDAGLDNIRIAELPKIELEASIKPTRVHLPSHYNLCFSILGMEMFKLAFCGESMVVTEPYVPRRSEECG
jgi:hypothetical protein